MLIDTLLLLAGLVLLIFGGNWLVKGASALAAFLGVSNFIIGLTVVAMGTSAPEASLAVLSSMMGEPTISFGGVIGSNMVNIGVVLAITCLFNPLTVRLALLRREVLFLVVSILTIAVLGIDGNIDVGNSLVLIAAWLAFLYFIARSAWTEREARRIGAPAEALIMERWQAVVLTVAGLVALIAGSELVIDGGVGLAEDLGVDEFIIGVT
ncbi:MAG: sodium:calcium antiporter, partial [Methanomassiliicoccales archaeon]|nr:sodium:calcium antiporter [Methanomassiliicoccales archaeon]